MNVTISEKDLRNKSGFKCNIIFMYVVAFLNYLEVIKVWHFALFFKGSKTLCDTRINTMYGSMKNRWK